MFPSCRTPRRPRRPAPSFDMNKYSSVPQYPSSMFAGHSYSHHVPDRSQGPSDVFSFQYHPPPTTVAPPLVQTPVSAQRRHAQYYQPTSPIYESPLPINSSTRKRKRVGTGENGQASKRPKQHPQSQARNPPINEAALPDSSRGVPGVGPSLLTQHYAPADRPKPIIDYSPVASKKQKTHSKQLATDVWYFMRPLDTREQPLEVLNDETPSRAKPKSPFVGCRLCPIESSWTVWSNTAGMADTIRTHLSSKHKNEWRKIVILEELKGYEKLLSQDCIVPTDRNDGVREPFTLNGFLERLVRWVTVDDQSMNVIESPELRNLFCYLNNSLAEDQIPHRKTLSTNVFENYNLEWKKLVEELKDSDGRISFTSDLWSDPNYRSFMAVTAHYCGTDKHGNLIIRNRLVAFRHVSGAHSGDNLAQHFLDIVKELGVLSKIGMITLDNASNCDTMMEALGHRLEELGISFDWVGNRIRCFPHVVNIVSKAALKHISRSAREDSGHGPTSSKVLGNDADASYQVATQSDIVAKCRSLVRVCRASGQRREDLQTTISEGNESHSFPNGKQLRKVQLLRDVDTRWSSTFLMIERVLELYPAIDVLLNKVKYREINHFLLSDAELRALQDVAELLKIPHAVQTILCSEKTPTLPAVLPTYEDFLVMLKSFKVICPQLQGAATVCIDKIEEYIKKTRMSRVHALAMIINPTIKLQWIKENWSFDEYSAAKEWMLNAMLEYQKLRRPTIAAQASLSRSGCTASSFTSTQSQSHGLAYIRSLKANLLRSASRVLASPSDNHPDVNIAASASSQSHSEITEAPDLALLDEKDCVAVKDELQRYLEEANPSADLECANFSLTRYWQSKQYQFPTMYRVALDILPAQASSVPCERVFSSSKETITLHRNCLSSELLEILQFLKYTYRQDRLNFVEEIAVPSEEDMISAEKQPVDRETVRDLLAKGQVDELVELLNV